MVHVYQLSAEGTISYDYDKAGNRTKKSRALDSGTDTVKYHYDEGGRNGKGRRLLYETIVGADGIERDLYGYRYDANGNLTGKSSHFVVHGDGTVTLTTIGDGVEYWEYFYDVQNRLIRVEKNGLEIAGYGYDVSGMRIYSDVGDRVTYYVYNFMGYNLYEEDDGENRSYIYLNGKKIIEVTGNDEEKDEIYYYHQDHLGSTSLITDQYGQVVANQDYLPFGDDLNRPGVLKAEGTHQARYKYTGQYHQYEIGLYYYGARFYDPRIGRFITEDTYLGNLLTPKSQHLYLYVLNNRVPRIMHS